ncbi:cytochrome c oxidase assembly factor 8 [Cynoglossus semilaevis]|uniref:Cytochrome c oxidase assembly factor 8 n=1 Tax=Cynoglossus semilaevis TaxID=244447 RepID=A0A3P8W1V2_CYNSE|nr:apoptogenic protein 1, mitochondrial [Cynoglossus semilaevis]
MTSVVMKNCLRWRSLRPELFSEVKCHFCTSEQSSKQQGTKNIKRSNVRPEPSSTYDWIGPPNPLSNLRPIVYRIPEKESELERRLRQLRQETEDWNHEFWTKQNISFSREKENFIFKQLKDKGLTKVVQKGRPSLSSEEMAVFYKSFLDKNKEQHVNYNIEWYKRNFTITLLMARVAFSNMWKSVRHSSS